MNSTPTSTKPAAESAKKSPRIAVVLPCYNEQATLGKVIADFRSALPTADIYVFDNNSTDNSAKIAAEAGAIVRHEPARGKGYVICRIFADVEADIYVLADSDDTLDASLAPKMIELLATHHVDMVVGVREGIMQDAGRSGHAFGNRFFNILYRLIFGRKFTDIFSGYRILTRRFVKSFPSLSRGFEIETQLCAHCSQLTIPVLECPTKYSRRPEGSFSKLHTIRDGIRILGAFILLAKEIRPVFFFGLIGFCLVMAAAILMAPLATHFLQTGSVPRIPTVIVSVGLLITAALSAFCGLLLDSFSRARIEAKRTAYLACKAPEW